MIKITNLKNLQKLLKAEKRVIVDFYADWCGPCHMMRPTYEKFSNEDSYKSIKFTKVNVDECEDIVTEYNISAMPTFLTFHNEKVLDTLNGANENVLREVLDKLVKA